jgi:hypothetical protein
MLSALYRVPPALLARQSLRKAGEAANIKEVA